MTRSRHPGPGRRLLVPAISTALMVAVLCGLGFWQVRRLQWKTALLARIDAAERAPGVPLPEAPLPFQKVAFSGRLGPELGRYGTEVRDIRGEPVLGSQVVGLVERPGEAPVLTVLGWLPDPTPYSPPAEPVALDGYARTPSRPGWFTPPDDLAHRHFYTLDPAVIGPALGAATVAPFAVVLLGAADGLEAPAPAQALPRPPNDHLQYAITWFGLAATLLAVFVVYARQRPAA